MTLFLGSTTILAQGVANYRLVTVNPRSWPSRDSSQHVAPILLAMNFVIKATRSV